VPGIALRKARVKDKCSDTPSVLINVAQNVRVHGRAPIRLSYHRSNGNLISSFMICSLQLLLSDDLLSEGYGQRDFDSKGILLWLENHLY